jgi:hypothetical protein
MISAACLQSNNTPMFFHRPMARGGGAEAHGSALHRRAANPVTRCLNPMDDGCHTLDRTRWYSWKVAHLGLGQQGPRIRDTMAFIPHQQLRRRILVPRLPHSASKRCSCIPRIQATRLTRKLNSGCWGPSSSEGPQKHDLTMFSKWIMWTGIFGFRIMDMEHGQDEAWTRRRSKTAEVVRREASARWHKGEPT